MKRISILLLFISIAFFSIKIVYGSSEQDSLTATGTEIAGDSTVQAVDSAKPSIVGEGGDIVTREEGFNS